VQEILYNRKAVRLSLTSEQIRNSPETDVSEPVSLRHEIELNQYYGWPADWLQEQHDVTPIGEMSGEPERQEADDMEEYTGPQLQSISEITGLFQIQANDVEIGKLTDFIIDDETWLIQYLTVEFSESPTGNIILSSDMVERIDWIGGYISVNALLETIKSSPAYDPSKLLTEKQIQTLHAHYG
jgi:hypothetical protein